MKYYPFSKGLFPDCNAHDLLIIFMCFSVFAGCAYVPYLQAPRTIATDIATEAGFTAAVITAGPFKLQSYHRGLHSQNTGLVVYIEGDGRAWRSKRRLSRDPSPKNPMALALATKDSSPAVLYIARPCQFLNENDLENCQPKYWSSHRYAEEVLQSTNEVIDEIKQRTGFKQLHIIGYSGGGVIAALLASFRDDVDLLVTVAANLDHSAWTKHHSVSPLTGSMNPLDYLDKLERVRQFHLVGEKDKIAPPELTEKFLHQMQNNKNVHLAIIPGFNHKCCWLEEWPGLLKKYR